MINHEIDYFDIVLKCDVFFSANSEFDYNTIPLESMILALSKETKFDRSQLSGPIAI